VSPRVHVKVCGVTSPDDAARSVEAGASAIGVHLYPASPRRVDPEEARRIVGAVAGRALVVLVVRDLPVVEMRELARRTGAGCLQLEGSEAPEDLAAMLPHAYKAIDVQTREDAARAAAYGGDYVLARAVEWTLLGDLARAVEWTLLGDLARARKLAIGGGLTPDNVAVVRGVEADGRPGRKDAEKIRAFVAAVAV
jgi:phosphoribosylanthranilate isomerase